MRRIRMFAVTAAGLLAALGTVPVATASATAAPSTAAVSSAPTTVSGKAAWSCSPGYFCIYSGWNGHGTRCQWSQPRKANTADNCSFIRRGQNVRSVWNRTRHRVQYYTQTNYHHRVGSTLSGRRGNLQGNYQIRSFRPQ